LNIQKLYRTISWTLGVPFFLVSPHLAWAEEGIMVDTSVVWQTPVSSPQLLSQHQHTPLWHFNNSTYFVWVDANLRAWITKIKDGVAETMPVDEQADYKVTPDSHNRFSMGIDKEGYIHITGDMHNYTTETTTGTYPVRYQKQAILYWKSNQPQNVNAGFSFVGGKNAPTAAARHGRPKAEARSPR